MADARTSSLSSDNANLDLLRSVAVFYVVGFHLLSQFQLTHLANWDLGQLGFLGVLFFFVHTSCVLMCSLERQEQKYPGALWTRFLVRRAFRIYPLSILIITCVLWFAIPVGHLRQGQHISAHVDLFGIGLNYLLAQDLFNRESVLVTLWSLPYEMHMYLLLPLAYLFARLRSGLFIFLCAWSTSLWVALHPYRLGQLGLSSFSQYVPCFLPGILAYVLSRHRSLRIPSFAWPLSLIGITLLYLKVSTSLSGWVSCLALGLLIPQFLEIGNSTSRRVFVLIARYSYGIYLTHVICIEFAFQRLAAVPRWLEWGVFLTTATAAPIILYHLVEAPMIRFGNRLMSRKPTDSSMDPKPVSLVSTG